jgi:hypothetical protein
VGELLDDIFRIYRRHFGLLLGLSMLLSLPLLAVQILVNADNTGFITTVLMNFGNQQALAGLPLPRSNLGLLLLSYPVLALVGLVTTGAMSLAAIMISLGHPATVGSVLRGLLLRAWDLLRLFLAQLVLVPLFLCLPVGIWIAVRWAVAVPALMAEGTGPISALGRSWDLTTRSWWRTLGILLLVYLLQSVVSGTLSVFGYPLAIMVPFAPQVVRGAIVLTVGTAASALSLPIVYLCVTLLYFDLRVRREGFDLDILAQQVR